MINGAFDGGFPMLEEKKKDISKVCKGARQFGVGFPGGVDVLIHFRIILEEVMRSGDID